MALGLCCQWLDPQRKRDGTTVWNNTVGERALRLGAWKEGKYSEERVLQTYEENVSSHVSFFKKLSKTGIKSFRLSSEVLPLFDYAGHLAKNSPKVMQGFSEMGRIAMENGIRITCHPGQFCILNSDRDEVIKNAVNELQYHAWMFDAMKLPQTPQYAINIHGGKRGAPERLTETILSLPHNVKSRLTLENDETCYSVKDLLSIHEKTDTPIVWDSHHHTFNEGGLTSKEACMLSAETWKVSGSKPLQHLSNSGPDSIDGSFQDRRKHSWWIHYIPSHQRQAIIDDWADVDIEAKGKNLALFRLAKELNISMPGSTIDV